MKKLWIALLFAAGSVLCGREVEQQRVSCGKSEITLVRRHFWNMNSLDYNGVNLCRKRSFFGNVIRFPNGWVGTGHKENKIGETELSVQFFADGKEFKPNGKLIKAEHFEMKKSSVLLDVKIDYDLVLTAEKLVERAKVTVLRDCEVRQFYLFMHPWCGIFTRAECVQSDGNVEAIDLAAIPEKKTVSRMNVAQIKYFAPQEKISATSLIRAITPAPGGKEAFLFWNRVVDRKLYFQPVSRGKLSAGCVFEYELTTIVKGE